MISLIPLRTFRGPLFPKPVTGQELFFAVSYSKTALGYSFQGTGRPVVPLSQDKNISLSRCPFVPGQVQEEKSQDKLRQQKTKKFFFIW